MKYMIEIEDEPFVRLSALFGEEGLYRVKGFNALVFDKNGLEKLTPLDKELEEAYQKGFEAGQHEATTLEYQQGLEEGKKQARAQAHLDVCHDIERVAHGNYQKGLDDAWECAKKLFSEMSDTEINLVFPQEWNNGGFKALMALDPKDAIDRIKAYEEQQKADKIAVGDEVRSNNAISDHSGIVLALSPGGNSAKVLENDGHMMWVAVNVLTKTGRRFNFLTALLEAMKGEQRICSTCKYSDGSDVSKCSDCFYTKGYNKWQPKEGAE